MDIRRQVQVVINRVLGKGEDEPLRAEDVTVVMERLAAQAEQWKMQVDEYAAMKRDIYNIALYLRNNYADEIARGKHTGLNLSEVVIMYLGRERELFRAESKSANPGNTDPGRVQ